MIELIISVGIVLLGVLFIVDFDMVDCAVHNGLSVFWPHSPEYCGYGGGDGAGLNQLIGIVLLYCGIFLMHTGGLEGYK